MFRIVRWTLGAGAAIAASVVITSAAAAPFDSCADGIRASVLKAGVQADIVDAAFRDIAFDEKAVRF